MSSKALRTSKVLARTAFLRAHPCSCRQLHSSSPRHDETTSQTIPQPDGSSETSSIPPTPFASRPTEALDSPPSRRHDPPYAFGSPHRPDYLQSPDRSNERIKAGSRFIRKERVISPDTASHSGEDGGDDRFSDKESMDKLLGLDQPSARNSTFEGSRDPSG